MKTSVKTVYNCEHCNKLYVRKHHCENHELVCSKNPENDRACFLCWNLRKVEVNRHVDLYHGEHEEKINILHCLKKDVFLYPPRVEHKKNYYDGADIGDGMKDNIPMVKECKDFNDNIIY